MQQNTGIALPYHPSCTSAPPNQSQLLLFHCISLCTCSSTDRWLQDKPARPEPTAEWCCTSIYRTMQCEEDMKTCTCTCNGKAVSYRDGWVPLPLHCHCCDGVYPAAMAQIPQTLRCLLRTAQQHRNANTTPSAHPLCWSSPGLHSSLERRHPAFKRLLRLSDCPPDPADAFPAAHRPVVGRWVLNVKLQQP